MANVMNDAVSLMQRVGSGIKKNLVRSNEGMAQIQSKKIARLNRTHDNFSDGVRNLSGNDLSNYLEAYRPANFRVGKGAQAWGEMTGEQRKIAIQKSQVLRSKEAERVADAIAGAQGKGTRETFNLLRDSYAGGETSKLSTVKSSAKAAGLMAQDYYTSGNFTQTATRVGVTAGAYMVGASGARYLSGGSMGYNSKGERDIVGVPFR
ncbi:MAG: hypothetical protein IIZ99_03350 [Turicibacter sp.]|nr:hypothetical protein [Turicibacter sp.]